MRVKILTYNILDGGVGREAFLCEIVQSQHADVIVLQEVLAAPFVEQLARALNYDLYIAPGSNRHALALLTRFPILTRNSYHPPPLRHTLLEARVDYAPGAGLYIFGVHLAAPA